MEPKRMGFEERNCPSEISQKDKQNRVTEVANERLTQLVLRGFCGQENG
jgi:hypothetical protein